MDQLAVERSERDWRGKLDIWPDGKADGNPAKSDNDRLPTNKLSKEKQERDGKVRLLTKCSPLKRLDIARVFSWE